jgi:hypothetical protein
MIARPVDSRKECRVPVVRWCPFTAVNVSRWRSGIALALLLPATLVAQAPTRVDSSARSTRAPASARRPEYRNLRFDEDWTTAVRTSAWGDAIKAIPLSPGGIVTLSVGGQLRWREEFVRGFALRDLNDDHAQSRVQLIADVRAGRSDGVHARAFVEARDAQSYGRTLPGGAGPSDADRHDVQNLFGEVALGSSFLRVGRQEIAINRERMFGVPDWANTRRAAQGARLQVNRGALSFELIDARPVLVRQQFSNVADNASRFRVVSLGSAAGAAPRTRGLPAVWQGYWIEQVVRAPTLDTRRLTSGARTMWQLGTAAGSRRYSLELEGAVQRGNAGANQLRAWFWVAETTLQWRGVRGVPSFALGVEEASGEQLGTSDVREVFISLYPAAHAHGGYADVIGRPNVRELHIIGTWAPARALSVRGAAYRFTRRRLDDGAWTKSNAVFRAANGSLARHVADEIDLTGSWRVSRHIAVLAGGAVVLPGDFRTGTTEGARRERWGFVGTTFTF